MTKLINYFCDECKIISKIEVKKEVELEKKEYAEILKLKQMIDEHNKNIKSKFIAKIFHKLEPYNSKIWSFRLVVSGHLFVDGSGVPYGSVVLLKKGFNHIKCPICGASNWFRKSGEVLMRSMINLNEKELKL